MKIYILIFIIITISVSFAQVRKDTLAKKDTTGLIKKETAAEKRQLPPVNISKTLIEFSKYGDPADHEYYKEFKKPLLMEKVGDEAKSSKEIIDENMGIILSDVRKANEDKRSPLIKTVQSALGIAQAAVVTALAVREIVKEIKGKPKK